MYYIHICYIINFVSQSRSQVTFKPASPLHCSPSSNIDRKSRRSFTQTERKPTSRDDVHTQTHLAETTFVPYLPNLSTRESVAHSAKKDSVPSSKATASQSRKMDSKPKTSFSRNTPGRLTQTIDAGTHSPSDTFRQINIMKQNSEFNHDKNLENFVDVMSKDKPKSARRRLSTEKKKEDLPSKLKKNFKRSVITNEPSPRLLELIELVNPCCIWFLFSPRQLKAIYRHGC